MEAEKKLIELFKYTNMQGDKCRKLEKELFE